MIVQLFVFSSQCCGQISDIQLIHSSKKTQVKFTSTLKVKEYVANRSEISCGAPRPLNMPCSVLQPE